MTSSPSKIRLGTWRKPKRNPYRVRVTRLAWGRGVAARRRRVSIDGNPYLLAMLFPGGFRAWAAWRRGWLEAGGYGSSLRGRRLK